MMNRPPITIHLVDRPGVVCPRCEKPPAECEHFVGPREMSDGTIELVFHDYMLAIQE